MRQIYLDETSSYSGVVKLSFYSPNEGYVAFQNSLGYTTDSGRTFIKKKITISNVDYNQYSVNLTFGFGISGVKAFDKNNILAYGDYGFVPAILSSVDGGNTFKLIYLSQFEPFNLRTGITDMLFPENGNIGYATDADRILKTTDKGLTWNAIYISSASYFDFLEGVDNNNVFAFSTSFSTSKLVKTTNAGQSWQRLNIPAGQLVSYANFITPFKGWLNTWKSNNAENTYYTADGGSSWKLMNPAMASFRTNKMKFVNDSTGYAVAGFEVYKTSDSGRIWERLPRDNHYSYLGYGFNDLQILNTNQFWAGGGDRSFLEITNNAGGKPVPSAYFAIDTTNLFSTNTVKLVNYSKPAYQYKWFVNNQPLANSYNASYTHNINSLHDSIKLIVSNGVSSDTSVQHQYFYPPVIVSSFSPAVGFAGTTVIIKGRNFREVTNVYFGGSPASFSVLSDTSISAKVGSGASGNVTVVTSTGMGSLAGFTFIPPPIVISFTPNAAIAGTIITITGQNFNNVTGVSFGNVPAASYTVVSPTIITAILGAGATGSVAVETANAGKSSLNGFVALPNITSFTPTSGTFGTYMTITGTGFSGVTGVSIGGTPVASFTVNSHASITAILAAGATGAVNVTTPGGSSALAGFSYFKSPAITSFTPGVGRVGSSVTISGTNFNPIAVNNIVYFGAVKAVVLSGTTSSLIVTVPKGATYQPISVTSNNLTAYSNRAFVVSFPNGGAITGNSFSSQFLVNPGVDQYTSDPVTGDIDGDGKPDLIVIKRGTYVSNNALTIFRNTSAQNVISFAPQVDYPVTDPGSIAVSDLDGDGKLDVVITDGDDYKVSLFKNTSTVGSISFAPRVNLITARMGGKIAIEDFDGDGKPDIVFSSWWESMIVIHRNISNPGTLAFSPRINIAGAAERNLIIRDMDKDGKSDIVVSDRILKNTSSIGKIAFESTVAITGYTHSYVAVGDIDGDGYEDIVSSDPVGSSIGILRQHGATPITFDPIILLNANATPSGIYLTDLDGDGKVDIATTLENYHASFLKNTSTPGTVSFVPKVDYLPGRYYDNSISIADINGDGRPDPIILPYIYINAVKPEPSIQSFTPTIGEAGTIVTITGVNFTGISGVSFGGVPAASFTVNSSGSITAVVANGASGSVTVTNNFGTASLPGFIFGFPPSITSFSPGASLVGSNITITGSRFSAVPAENVVYFGNVRTVVTAATANQLTVKVPAGSNYQIISVTTRGLTAYAKQPFITTFPNNTPGFTASSFGGHVKFIGRSGKGTTGDIDGDGKLDVVLTDGDKKISISINTSTGSSITLAPAFSLGVNLTPRSITLGDVDGDGKQDIIVAHDEANFLSVIINKSTPGNLSFLPKVDFSTGLSASGDGVVVRDLDQDGKPEIIIAGYKPQTISVFKNQSTAGNPSFGAQVEYGLGGYATGLRVEDLNGDNKPELIASVNAIGSAVVFRNTSYPGTISFGVKQDFKAGSWPETVSVGDLDGDGKADLAIPNANSASVSILQNTSTGGAISFAPKSDYEIKFGPSFLWLNDLDGDGKPELVVQKEATDYIFLYSKSVSVFKNISTAGKITFATPVEYDAGNFTLSSTSADLDSDSKPDILIFGSASPTNVYGLVVLRNQAGEAATISLCANANAIIGSNVKGASYQWQQNTGSGFVNISNNANFSGTITDSLKLSNVPSTWNGFLYRCVLPTDTSVISVLSVNDLPVANAGVDTSICSLNNNGVMLGTATLSNHTYAWSPSTGLNAVSIAQPIAKPTASTAYILTVTNSTGCVSKDTAIVSLINTPAPTISSGGANSFCIGGSVMLTSSTTNGNQWYKDGLAITAATNRTYQAAQSGIYSVNVSANGCSSSRSAGVTVVASPVPAPPTITASGSTSFCLGGSVSLTSSDSIGANQWYRDGNAISGATGYIYSASLSGSYSVKRTLLSCSSNAAIPVVVNVNNTIPTPVVTASGPVNLCEGETVTLTSNANVGNQWYINNTVIQGATGSSFIASKTGTFTVRVSSNGCTSNLSNTTSVVVNPVPVTPVITESGNVLSSSATAGNQWYLNGAVITGATEKTFVAAANGTYTNKVTINGCSSALSNAITIATTPGVIMGPNPVSGKLYLQYPGNTDQLTVMLMDIYGQSVLEQSTFKTYYEIDMSKYLPGTYIVQIINNQTGKREQRIIIKI